MNKNRFKVKQRVYTFWESYPHGQGGITINAYIITRVITDKSNDVIKGDYVARSLDQGNRDRQFFSEIDLLDLNEILEKVEEVLTKKITKVS